MQINTALVAPDLLLAAIDRRRETLASLRSRPGAEVDPIPYVDVAAAVGTHSATFSRLKNGRLPGAATIERLVTWAGVSDPSELYECGECGEDHASDDEGGDGEEQPETADQTAMIFGAGRLSESEDEATASAVTRVRELLQEGAVGVSIRTDLDPSDMPSQSEIDALIEEEKWEELDELFENLRIRPRHLAIVDTAAFADCRLELGEDGFSVSGPVTFEGTWTGDVRQLPYGALVWDDVLPIPIIWDREDGDHTGQVVGLISEMERIEGVTSSLSPAPLTEDDVNAVVAAAGSDVLRVPDAYFSREWAQSMTAAVPLTFSDPDERGMRMLYGVVAPAGVCHRSNIAPCFTYPGDVDPQHKGFHTGFPLTLESGRVIRPGALTMKDLHLDVGLAKRGVGAREANRHREDANEVLAAVEAFETPYGLGVSGVVMPDVSDASLLRAATCAASVELWPAGAGRTLVGLHLVPTPAWPVAASMGSASLLTWTPESIAASAGPDLATADDSDAPDGEGEAPEEEQDDTADETDIAPVLESLDRVEQALALLVSELIDSPSPEADDEEQES